MAPRTASPHKKSMAQHQDLASDGPADTPQLFPSIHYRPLAEQPNLLESVISPIDSEGAYDSNFDQTTLGRVDQQDIDTWGKDVAQFIRSDAGINGLNWVGRRPLGKGNFGIAGLWDLVDGNGRTTEQMVIKQVTGLSAKAGKEWDSRLPMEVRIMRRMNQTKCRAVVQLLNYARYPNKKVHRIYLEYCPYGDLKRLIKRYRRFRCYLPEPFIWDVFNNLVQAAAAMHSKPLGPHQGYEIVHMDIKPENIFLAKPDAGINSITHYPMAKMADFGISSKVEATDPSNPKDYMGAGTPAYMAPEQRKGFIKKRKPRSLPSWRILSHTNVWAIGAVIYEMVTLRRVINTYFRDVDRPQGIVEITTDHRPEYSDALRATVRDCLKPRTIDRPNIPQLQRVISENIHAHMDTKNSNSEAYDRLYYINDEISGMEPGEWRPHLSDIVEDPDNPEGFRDPDFPPINFPRLSDEQRPQGPAQNPDEVMKERARRFAEWESHSRTPDEQVNRQLSDDDDSDYPEITAAAYGRHSNPDGRAGPSTVDGEEQERRNIMRDSDVVPDENELEDVGPEEEDQSITQHRRRQGRGRGYLNPDLTTTSENGENAEGNENVEYAQEAEEEDEGVEQSEESDLEANDEEAERDDSVEENSESDDEDDTPITTPRRSKRRPVEDETYVDLPTSDEDDDEPSVTPGRRRQRGRL